jgi:Kef-type K+ transport system membrane component KefB
MQHPYAIACLWFGLALVATFLGTRLKISNALLEITVGVIAGAAATAWFGPDALGAKEPWLVFVASTGAVVLTFLAGAELDPAACAPAGASAGRRAGELRRALPGLRGHRPLRARLGSAASWLAGIALSTTSMAVVYAVMLETGLNGPSSARGSSAPAS